MEFCTKYVRKGKESGKETPIYQHLSIEKVLIYRSCYASYGLKK